MAIIQTEAAKVQAVGIEANRQLEEAKAKSSPQVHEALRNRNKKQNARYY
jgi:hypothetical protein